ncbi:hypothetical protein [Fulvivirga ligni]|uniref:hypothetical protein n=1 Tax=Fulvivirga ligni TaxID=2904246 RepID=UPI001F37E09A|nr:hypothetical protein [Fulvivirga ligni]UII19258.1 hypothetical protein LVD16_15540 [Fulvivirga ligni]
MHGFNQPKILTLVTPRIVLDMNKLFNTMANAFKNNSDKGDRKNLKMLSVMEVFIALVIVTMTLLVLSMFI